jgi:hypothetical protein
MSSTAGFATSGWQVRPGGRDATRIRDELRDAASWDDRFAMTDAKLLRRYEAAPSVGPEVARAWARLVASRGRVGVDELAVENGWSRTRLWFRFGSQIGLSPKRAARLSASITPPTIWPPASAQPGRRRGRLYQPIRPPPGRTVLRGGDAHRRGWRWTTSPGRDREHSSKTAAPEARESGAHAYP